MSLFRSSGSRTATRVALALAAAALVSATSCAQPEQRPGTVEVTGGKGGSASASASGSASTSVSGAGPGVVQPKPAEAIQVDVTLGEWYIAPNVPRVKAGQVYFLVENRGPADPHELVIIRDDRAPSDLPVVEGKVPEDQINLIGEVEAFAPNSRASGVFDLQPGHYLLICNIVETEDGQQESHYLEGMRASLVVE